MKCCALCGAVGVRAGSECEAAAGWGARCVAACGAFRPCVCACDEQTAAMPPCGRLRAEGAQRVARGRAVWRLLWCRCVAVACRNARVESVVTRRAAEPAT